MAEPWQTHDGGDCPVMDDRPVEIETKDGHRSSWKRAGSVIWRWDAYINEAGAPIPHAAQVARYRKLPRRAD